MNSVEQHINFELNTYPRKKLTIVRGKNAKVWTDTDEEYIDCIAGIGVANVGHCNPEVVEAIKKQAEKIITCPNIFYNDTRGNAFEKLIEIAPAGITKAFFTNSGAEAMESAMKFARFFTGRNNFVAMIKGFHGRSMGALSATFKSEYKEGFGKLLPGVSHAPYNKIEKLREAVTEETAAVIIEPIQGEGGINIADTKYLKEVRAVCNKTGALLIIDEIQTGFCRTGKIFAIEHSGVKPDLITVAKGIAGGYPVGAVLCSDKIEIPVGKHGTTFGGNPLGSAAVEATINFIQKNKLWMEAEKKGKYFLEKLEKEKLSKVRQVRARGLMIGIECKEKVTPLIEQLMEEKILSLPAGPRVIRMLPPITINYKELDIVIEKLKKILK